MKLWSPEGGGVQCSAGPQPPRRGLLGCGLQRRGHLGGMTVERTAMPWTWSCLTRAKGVEHTHNVLRPLFGPSLQFVTLMHLHR